MIRGLMVLNMEDALKPLCWKGMGSWLVDELRRTLDALERSVEEVEYATAEWVDWFNHHRLYCGDIPPVELETAHYAQTQRPAAG